MVQQYKIDYVNNLSEKMKGKPLIFCNYIGITVADITEVRSQLREKGSTFNVIKNTLFKRAADSIKLPYDEQILDGPIALCTVRDDFTEIAKIIANAEKKELMKIKGGFFNDAFIDPDQVKKISKILPRDQLIAVLIGSIEFPISGLVYTLNGIISNLVYTLQAIEDKKKE
ncbi:50S ribosomal protein L10 [Spirochaetota bacterium]